MYTQPHSLGGREKHKLDEKKTPELRKIFMRNAYRRCDTICETAEIL